MASVPFFSMFCIGFATQRYAVDYSRGCLHHYFRMTYQSKERQHETHPGCAWCWRSFAWFRLCHNMLWISSLSQVHLYCIWPVSQLSALQRAARAMVHTDHTQNCVYHVCIMHETVRVDIDQYYLCSDFVYIIYSRNGWGKGGGNLAPLTRTRVRDFKALELSVEPRSTGFGALF